MSPRPWPRRRALAPSVLDPLEGLSDASEGDDYLQVMQSNLHEPAGGIALPLTEALVELRGATLGYADTPVLRDVDFAISAGEFVAIVGPNGSGKSTLVKSILGLTQRTRGRARALRRPVPSSYRERWRIGYVPQRHTVGGPIPATVREVVSSGRLPRSGLWRLPNAADRRAVNRAMERVTIGDLASRPVHQLSGGQQRRVLIATGARRRDRVCCCSTSRPPASTSRRRPRSSRCSAR